MSAPVDQHPLGTAHATCYMIHDTCYKGLVPIGKQAHVYVTDCRDRQTSLTSKMADLLDGEGEKLFVDQLYELLGIE